jgi:pimeloyl-ACP methyl ester carboxylesterase
MMSPVFERLPELVNGHADLVRRGRFLTVTFLVASGPTHDLVRVVEGRIERVERGPFLMRDWRFAVRAYDAQGGPGVFRGDLYVYRAEGDLRGAVDAIDTRRCPLYLLTGEYDFSCTPDDTRRTAAAIKGARVTVMKGVGHFPMREHPAQFRTYLLPVLDEIRAHPARP